MDTLRQQPEQEIHEEVRRRYAAAALAATEGRTASCGEATPGHSASCCEPTAVPAGSGDQAAGGTGACCAGSAADGPCCDPATHTGTCCGTASAAGTGTGSGGFGAGNYPEAEWSLLPPGARTASLGCGNPLLVADLHEGETVLDLGSGGGGDVLLSARRVGPSGRVYGLDMTDEMLALARANAAAAGVSNVEFRKGTIEDIPLPDASVDVVISNCVINLSPDKPAVFAQMHRVLRSGGRVGVSDVVAEDRLTAQQRAERGSWAGCIAGALSRSEYVDALVDAGFTKVDVTLTHEVADGIHSAIVTATRP